MKILFLTHYYWPHIGGVERHVAAVGRELAKQGNEVTIITEKYDQKLKDNENINRIKVIRFNYPHIKLFGLISIWFWLFKNCSLIKQTDIIHCHDVFIWYFPFRFLYPKKSVYTTIHGLEWDNPFSKISIWQKRLAVKLSSGTIGVGFFLERYLNTKFDEVVYGGADSRLKASSKKKGKIVYVGRLEVNTGLKKFLEKLNKNKHKVDFCGDGPLRRECEKYGKVHGFCDPAPFLEKAEICVPGGYLSYIEALKYGCEIQTFFDSPLKKDYWNEIKKIKEFPTWNKVASVYENLYLHNRTK